ncbi:40S small subunit processome assembly factor 1 [Xenentodon cancila]
MNISNVLPLVVKLVAESAPGQFHMGATHPHFRLCYGGPAVRCFQLHGMNSQTAGKRDNDGLFLERVLEELYDFGSAPKKKLLPDSQKKKKRKRREEEEEDELHTEKHNCKDSEDIREEETDTEQQPRSEQTGPTIQQRNQVEVVTFKDPAKKPKTKQTPAFSKISVPQTSEKKQSSKQEELSLEKARLEVHRFGITGYEKQQQRVFEQDRAVMLGARPPKKDYVNYKELQQQLKEKKQKEKEEVEPDKKKKKKKKQSAQRDKKSTSDSGVAPSGQVGRFKNGMLILSSKEIQKIKSKK